MTRTLNGLCDLLLEFLRCSRQAARQNLALLVEELFKELAVLVIDILNAEFLETAVLLFLDIHRYRIEVAEFARLIVFLLQRLLPPGSARMPRTTLLRILDSVLVLLES